MQHYQAMPMIQILIQTKLITAQICFFVLLFMNIGATFFDGSLGNILDAVVMKKIHSAEHKVDFGRQRMFGAPAFVVGGILAKHLVDVAPAMSVSCYTILYILYWSIHFDGDGIFVEPSSLNKANPKNNPEKSSYGHTLMIVCLKTEHCLIFWNNVY